MTQKGHLVSIREKGADYPIRVVMLTRGGKRRGTDLVEIGIKGKGVVKRIDSCRIFHDFGEVQ